MKTKTATANQQQTSTKSLVAIKREGLKKKLEEAIPQLQRIATKHIKPERMIQLALRSVAKNPKILECTPSSVLGCVFESQSLGLEIDSLGQGYIVPFKNQAQFIIGYKGLINLAQRTGKIASIHADLVRQEEIDKGNFDYAYGSEYYLRHKPLIKEWDSGYKDVTAIYAYAKLNDGGFYFVVLPKSEVEKTRLRSPSGRKSESAWATDWDEMAKKTAIRKLSKYLPMSIEFERALKLDELGALGQEQNLDINRINADGLIEFDLADVVEEKVVEKLEEKKEESSTVAKKESSGSVKLPMPEKEDLFDDAINWESVDYVVSKIKETTKMQELVELEKKHKADIDRFGGKDAERISATFLEKVNKLRGIK